VIDARDSPAAEESADALVALNDLLRRWEADGLALGWTDCTAVTDTLAVPNEALRAVAYNLAVDLAPEYGKQPSQLVLTTAYQLLGDLLRDRLVEMPMAFDRTGTVYDITTDSYR
jgi:hypothetical protein